MKSEQIKNKQEEILKTKEGKTLMKHTLEPGDEFIPEHNNIIERKNKTIINDKEQIITNYSIKCSVKTKDNTQHDDIYISLTPAQAKSLKKKIEAGIELNQNLFITYKYEHEEYGTCVGVGMKSERKPPKQFSDFEQTKE